MLDSNYFELVIIITILKNTATAVKAFLLRVSLVIFILLL